MHTRTHATHVRTHTRTHTMHTFTPADLAVVLPLKLWSKVSRQLPKCIAGCIPHTDMLHNNNNNNNNSKLER